MTDQITKQEFRRVEDYVYELPAGTRPHMRVPARIYADDAILEDALGDRSVIQLANTASLPGVVRYTMAMPDIHQGYGFPIGGVAATELPSGVVSPGGIGYDINCLAGESLILHRFGYHRRIDEMADTWQQTRLVAQDFETEASTEVRIVNYLRMRPRSPVLEVTTETGDQVRATADHPFWTPNGMKPLGELSPGDQVARMPFQGVAYTPPSDEVIVSEDDLRAQLAKFGKGASGHSVKQNVSFLTSCGLLPLRYSSPALPYLCKVLGFLLGDGTMRIDPRSGKGLTSFYGKAPDLERLRADLEAIGVTPSRVYSRHREHTIQTPYAEYSFEHLETHVNVSSSAFVALLTCLGAPLGNKAQQDYTAPAWLEVAPSWQKRLFLAALFGAELTTPATMTGHGTVFAAPTLSMNKRKQYVASGLEFLHQIATWLEQFGVETQSIASRAEQVNADGERSVRLRLILSNKTESLINLWSRVGYEYHDERAGTAALAVQYLKYKQQAVARREEAARAAVALAEQSVPRHEILAQLVGPHVNERFIERSLYEGRATSPRVGKEFATFAEFCADAGNRSASNGVTWERVARIEPAEYDGDVYDFTVNHPDHNFIANGFVVSNCGVRLAVSQVTLEEMEPHLKRLVDELFNTVPTGVGKGGEVRLSDRDMDAVLERGSEWAVQKGYGYKADLEHTEERGAMTDADARAVSPRAKKRGRGQLGTLGSGNHFIEVEVVEQVFDAEAAEAFGLREGQIAVLIHSGSRGLGHQVCTDYVRDLQRAVQKYKIHIPDRELVCAPMDSPEGQAYFGAMAAAANYAWTNRQCLLHLTRQAFEKALKGQIRNTQLALLYDVAHNIGKIETHMVGGREVKVCVHRKGATRAFGPGRRELPRDFRAVGQPVLIPGDMGSGSWVLVGTQQAMETTFGSTCHGAGRVLSRAAAKREARGEDVVEELRQKGIVVRGASMKGIAEEAPGAYKDVDRVVNVVHRAGIARKVARLRPLGVIKG